MTGKIMPLRERDTSTVQAAADAFLSSPRYANPHTRRGYMGVLDRLLAGLGASRPLAEVSGEELAGLLEQLWGRCAPATWNRNRGAVTAWLSWCAASRLAAPVLPASAERRREHLNATRAVPRPAIERALTRRDVPASTAATAASNNEVRVCRTPRGSRRSGTRARNSARPGHCPDSSTRSPGGRPESCSRAAPIGDDDKAGTVFRGDHGIRQPHDLGSRACTAARHPVTAMTASTRHHATMLGPWGLDATESAR